MASGLALRTVLHRTRQTAVIAALEGVTRPENMRMVNLLDIHVETIAPESIHEFDRVCMVDVQPHYFPGLDRVDLVIDHHPEQHGYNAVFKDIREDYGSTCTILTEHLRAIDASISERTAPRCSTRSSPTRCSSTARRTAATSTRSPISIRWPTPPDSQDGRRGNHRGAAGLDYQGHAQGRMVEQVFSVFLGDVPRDDAIPYVADFFLQLENVRWTLVSGVINGMFVMSFATSATRRTPAISCGAISSTSVRRAATGRWRRPSSRSMHSRPASASSTTTSAGRCQNCCWSSCTKRRMRRGRRSRWEPLTHARRFQSAPPTTGSMNWRYASS
jgi:hypothetical protein